MPGVTATGAATKTVGNIRKPMGADVDVPTFASLATGNSTTRQRVKKMDSQDRDEVRGRICL